MSGRTISRRHFLKATTISLPALTLVGNPFRARAASGSKSSEFVTVRKGRFELRGRPYTYIGTNLWYGCYLSESTLPGGRQRLIRELDRLQRIGATNIRLLAGSETSPLVGAIRRGITRAPRDWDEELLKGLDFCLDEMAKRDMRAILFLSNYWQWSGSFSQYVRWATGEDIPDPDKPEMAKGDWTGFIRFSGRMYSIPAANQLYLDYASHLIRRRNTVNGRIYHDDPTIMTWELANEPRPGPDGSEGMENVPTYVKWVDQTARFIHSEAPNQLVCTGSEGVWGCLQQEDVFVKVHKTSAIDYVTVHMWLKNWGWLKEPKLGDDFEKAAEKAKDHVEMHTRLATDKLHKPLVLEEFGLPRDHEKYGPENPTTARDEYYRRMFAQVADSCKQGRALQGANFWAWGGEGRVGGKQESSTALMGDPFCEPQGLNSVFDTDTATLAVVTEANRNLAALRKG